jgi:hypothetical protein
MKELARIVFSQNSECNFNLPFTDFEPLFSSYFSEYSKECNNSYSTSSSLGLLTVWAVVWLNRNWRLVLSLVRTVGIYMDTVWRNVLGGDTRNTLLLEMLAGCFLLIAGWRRKNPRPVVNVELERS